jgi:hypothetical protein
MEPTPQTPVFFQDGKVFLRFTIIGTKSVLGRVQAVVDPHSYDCTASKIPSLERALQAMERGLQEAVDAKAVCLDESPTLQDSLPTINNPPTVKKCRKLETLEINSEHLVTALVTSMFRAKQRYIFAMRGQDGFFISNTHFDSAFASNPALASRPFHLRAEGTTTSSAKKKEMQVQLL